MGQPLQAEWGEGEGVLHGTREDPEGSQCDRDRWDPGDTGHGADGKSFEFEVPCRSVKLPQSPGGWPQGPALSVPSWAAL